MNAQSAPPLGGRSITSEQILVTPGLAAIWLAHNGGNRPLMSKTVASYAAAMSRGEWRENGEPLIFSREGRLMDGQHRLSAIVESGVSLTFLVVRGVNPEFMHTLDTGKVRTGADVLAMSGLANAKCLAAAARWLWLYGKRLLGWSRVTHQPSRPELLAVVSRLDPDLCKSVSWVTGHAKLYRLIPAAPLAFLHYLFSRRDSGLAEEFFRGLEAGENLEKGNPVYALRERLVDNSCRVAKLPKEHVVALTMKAFLALAGGKRLYVLKFLPSEEFPTLEAGGKDATNLAG